jgi:cytoskeletal protein CcmA (bactofilin family)
MPASRPGLPFEDDEMLKRDHKKRRLEDKVGPTESVIAPGTKFKGTICGPDSLRISGRFEGEIESERLVRVDKEGKIHGIIKAPYIIVEGELNGNIEAAEQVELRAQCRMIGNINAAMIAMAEGGFFEGEIKMPRKEDKPIKFVEKRISEPQEG